MNTTLLRRVCGLLRQIAGFALSVLCGGTAIHTLVMLIDYTTYQPPHRHHFDLWNVLFSPAMLPMTLAYCLLSLLIVVLWRRERRALKLAHKQEVDLARQQAALKTAQRLTGITVEQISTANTAILEWLRVRRSSGHDVPNQIVRASTSIGLSLRSLSEVVFGGAEQLNDEGAAEDYAQSLIERLERKVADAENDAAV